MLTIAALEAELVDRCGGKIDKAKLSAAPGYSCAADASPRRYLAFPLALGAASLRPAKLPTADPLALTDADLTAAGDAFDGFAPWLLDVAELRLYETILGRWDKPDQQVGIDNQKWQSMMTDLQNTIDKKRDWLKAQYGIGATTLKTGRIDLAISRSCRRTEF